MDEILRLTQGMDLAPPASRSAIREAEKALGMKLPPDYVEFLLLHNGGEGAVGGEGWARLMRTEDLAKENALCSDLDHLASWLLFGTDGADEAFVFDDSGQALMVPWLGGRDDAIPQGRFLDFLRRLGTGLTFEQRGS